VTALVLWGFHPAYVGQDGRPYLLRLASGRDCTRERRQRQRDGGWTLATYAAGTEPVGLQLQLDQHLSEGTTP